MSVDGRFVPHWKVLLLCIVVTLTPCFGTLDYSKGKYHLAADATIKLLNRNGLAVDDNVYEIDPGGYKTLTCSYVFLPRYGREVIAAFWIKRGTFDRNSSSFLLHRTPETEAVKEWAELNADYVAGLSGWNAITRLRIFDGDFTGRANTVDILSSKRKEYDDDYGEEDDQEDESKESEEFNVQFTNAALYETDGLPSAERRRRSRFSVFDLSHTFECNSTLFSYYYCTVTSTLLLTLPSDVQSKQDPDLTAYQCLVIHLTSEHGKNKKVIWKYLSSKLSTAYLHTPLHESLSGQAGSNITLTAGFILPLTNFNILQLTQTVSLYVAWIKDNTTVFNNKDRRNMGVRNHINILADFVYFELYLDVNQLNESDYGEYACMLRQATDDGLSTTYTLSRALTKTFLLANNSSTGGTNGYAGDAQAHSQVDETVWNLDNVQNSQTWPTGASRDVRQQSEDAVPMILLTNSVLLLIATLLICVVCSCGDPVQPSLLWVKWRREETTTYAEFIRQLQVLRRANLPSDSAIETRLQADVCVSFASSDAKWVEKNVVQELKSRQYDVRIDRSEFVQGRGNGVEVVAAAMSSSRKVIAVVSKEYIRERWKKNVEMVAVYLQLITADGPSDQLMPIKINQCKMPEVLSSKRYIDLDSPAMSDAGRSFLEPLLNWLGPPNNGNK